MLDGTILKTRTKEKEKSIQFTSVIDKLKENMLEKRNYSQYMWVYIEINVGEKDWQ